MEGIPSIPSIPVIPSISARSMSILGGDVDYISRISLVTLLPPLSN